MKLFIFYLKIIIMLFSMFLASCKKETESEPKITMISKSMVGGFLVRGSGSMTIDWGDGAKTETHTLDPHASKHFFHDYNVISEFIITITGNNITHFDCSNKNLTSLNISSNETLTYLDCRNCRLTSLDVSNCPALQTLRCFSNPLTSLDVSKNWILKELYCSNNQLSDLDLSNNALLEFMDCRSNSLSTEALNALFETLHHYSTYFGYQKKIWIDDNPGTDFCDRNIAEKRGWTVLE